MTSLHAIQAANLAFLTKLFADNPRLVANRICLLAGHVDVETDDTAGSVRDWCHALPSATRTTGLARTTYGATEATVLTSGQVRVVVRPHVVPGGVR